VDIAASGKRETRDHARKCVVQTGRKASSLGRKPDPGLKTAGVAPAHATDFIALEDFRKTAKNDAVR
jgi:hypothetical protein